MRWVLALTVAPVSAPAGDAIINDDSASTANAVASSTLDADRLMARLSENGSTADLVFSLDVCGCIRPLWPGRYNPARICGPA